MIYFAGLSENIYDYEFQPQHQHHCRSSAEYAFGSCFRRYKAFIFKPRICMLFDEKTRASLNNKVRLVS